MLRISDQQKELLDELRSRISDVLEDESEYRNSDAFLINWLLHKNSNVPQVESAFRKHAKWRREQKIEGIPTEIVENLTELLPYKLHGVDKAGRPIVWVRVGKWDIASFARQGKEKFFERYAYQFCENIERAIIAEQNKLDLGDKNVDGRQAVWQFTGVFDLEGLALRPMLNARTIKMVTNLTAIIEANWPIRCGNMIQINAPSLIKVLLKLLMPFLSNTTKAGMRVYGSDRQEWESALHDLINVANIPSALGGTRSSHLYDVI